MKTVKSLSTALLILASFGVMANSAPAKKNITAPAFSWGSPDDLNTAAVELLKNSVTTLAAPQFSWGSAEDLNDADLEALKIMEPIVSFPEMVIGTADDLDTAELALLKTNIDIPYPAIVIGNPEELDAIIL